MEQPWPDVPECFGHGQGSAETCPQCDGAHEHRWAEGHAVLARVPVRCVVCGARKCDMAECLERRHHRSPHLSMVDGSLTKVGI